MAGRSSRKGEIDWKLDDPLRQSATAEHLLRCHLTEREWFYRFARHDSRQELHSRRLNLRLFIFIAVASALFGREGYAASPDVSAANTGNLDFKQWGLLAIQDGGRRKPVHMQIRQAKDGGRTISSCRLWSKRTIGKMSQWY